MNVIDEYYKIIKGIELKDRNNPLSLIAENIAVSIKESEDKRMENEKRIYPFLADTTELLLAHINYKDEDGMFATPSTTHILLTIGLKEFINGSTYSNNKHTMTLPKRSIVEVDKYTFMVNKDIHIEVGRYNQRNIDKFIPFVYTGAESVITIVDDTGVIPSKLVYDDNGVGYIVFEIPVIESNVIVNNVRVIKDNITKVEIPITNQYVKSVIEIKRNGVWEQVDKFYSYSKTLETNAVHVLVEDDKVYYTVDKKSSSTINGDVRIVTITCSGRLFLNLNEFSSKDYKLTSFDSTFNIPTTLYSNRIINSGKDRLTLRALKNRIINRVFSNKGLPITKYDITDRLRGLGLVGTTYSSSLLGRIFTARGDLFSTGETLPRSHYLRYKYNPQDTNVVQTIDDNIVVLEGTYFKHINGNLTAVSHTEIASVKNNLSTLSDIYYRLPYRYILNTVTSSTSSVYQCDRPEVGSVVITSKNSELNESCNINHVDIVRENNGYRTFFKVLGNTEYDLIKADVSIDIKLEIDHGTVTFNATVDQGKNIAQYGVSNGYYSFFIDLGLVITNGRIEVLNGTSTVNHKWLPLDGSMKCVIRYKDNSLETTQAGLDYYTPTIGFSKHSIAYTFIKEVKNIIAESSVELTSKRYKTYPEDVYETYPEDVYQYNPTLGTTLTIVDTDNDGIGDAIERYKTHSAGDFVYDINHNHVIKHHAGDVIMVGNTPQVDEVFGKSAEMYLVLFDAIFDFVNETLNGVPKSDIVINLIDEIIFSKLDNMNKIVLEKSSIKYLPWLTNYPVIDTNKNRYERYLKPSVSIYFRKGNPATTHSMYNVTLDIGTEIARTVTKLAFEINTLEESLIKLIGNGCISVEIKGIPRNIKLNEDSNRFILSYKIGQDNKIIYDVDYTIVKI